MPRVVPTNSTWDPRCHHIHHPLASGINHAHGVPNHRVCPQCQVWSHYEEAPVEEVVPVLEEKERTANYKPVFVTEITDDLHFYVQDVETGTGTALASPSLPAVPKRAPDLEPQPCAEASTSQPWLPTLNPNPRAQRWPQALNLDPTCHQLG